MTKFILKRRCLGWEKTSKKAEPKKQKNLLPLPMIAVGMKRPAMILAVAGFVAAAEQWDKPLLSL